MLVTAGCGLRGRGECPQLVLGGGGEDGEVGAFGRGTLCPGRGRANRVRLMPAAVPGDFGLCVVGRPGGSVLVTGAPSGRANGMKRIMGVVVLGLSACGYPLTQLAVRRCGVRGAVMAESACAGLAIRDALLVASGVPDRLRNVPAALLRLELAVAVVASLAGLHPLLSTWAPGPASARARAADNLRRTAVAALFTMHTIRFAIYLRPDQGRRAATPGAS